ncbi:hypothetical protein JOD54_005817 [Actinokineospora baliensis]|uniref:hypothetical protein n=1 Tax=Actinokineospora baliensis TaxID=547056 RepID=UPI00195EC29E|nr:hypothetical protein [Actinokineospora baliensis]MBM7775613.1 hypothetical protein [Actinokineospora baliensis]
MIVRLLLTGLLAAAALVVGAPTANAAACESTGVTVVVDFGSLGGGVQTRCAPGDPNSGLTALAQAGFGYTFPTRQPGFVCRIDNRPGPDIDACVNTPPATAYWSYWHADRGGSWNYSSFGAANRDPASGTVEGWSYGAGKAPGVAPPAKPAPNTPVVPPQPAPVPTVAPPAAPPRTTTLAPTTATTAASLVPTTTAQPTTTTAGVAPTSSAHESTTTPSPPQPEPAAAQKEAGGGSMTLIVVGAVVVLLAGIAAVTARRRAKDE